MKWAHLWAPVMEVTANARKTRYPTAGRLVVIPTADYKGPGVNSRPQICGKPLAYVLPFPRQLAVGLISGRTAASSRGMYADAGSSLAGTGAVLFVSPSVGHAGTINITAGTAGTIPAGAGINDFIAAGSSGARLAASTDRHLTSTLRGPRSSRSTFSAAKRTSTISSSWRPVLFDHAAGPAHFAEYRLAPGHASRLRSLALACWRFTSTPTSPALRTCSTTANPDDSGHALVDAELLRVVQSVQRRAEPRTTCDRLWIFLDDSGGGVNGGGPDVTMTTSRCG